MTIPCDNCVYVFTRDKKPKETEFVELEDATVNVTMQDGEIYQISRNGYYHEAGEFGTITQGPDMLRRYLGGDKTIIHSDYGDILPVHMIKSFGEVVITKRKVQING